MKKIILSIVSCLLLLSLFGCAAQPVVKTPLVVFAAGSLIKPFNDLKQAFEAKYPNIEVQNEFHGSIQVMRHAAELHEPIDVVATADHALIPMVMYQSTDPASGKKNASWYLRFATNRLGLAYSLKSKYANEINADNWSEILTRQDVKVGLADPRFDASGYRSMMVVRLAQDVLNKPDLFEKIFGDAFKYPVMVDEEMKPIIIRVPEILETKKSSHLVLRGSSIQLLALLESGDLDYAFEYESVIKQHGLKLISLPAQLNLGDAGQVDVYHQVMVKLDFQRFASVKPEFVGDQIGYGVTIPAGAPHPKEAELFIAFLLSPEGKKIMAGDFHPLLEPVTADHYDFVPDTLKPLSQPAP
jgi:molybdate/tungstate transport system substrate-binding protein